MVQGFSSLGLVSLSISEEEACFFTTTRHSAHNYSFAEVCDEMDIQIRSEAFQLTVLKMTVLVISTCKNVRYEADIGI